MGIILLTELGKIPWQLRFSPSLPSLATPMVDLATPTEAPRALLDTDTADSTRERLMLDSSATDLPSATTVMVATATPPEASRESARDLLSPLMLVSTDMDLPSPSTDMELPATRPEAPRDSVERERLKPRPSPLTSVDTTVPVLLT